MKKKRQKKKPKKRISLGTVSLLMAVFVYACAMVAEGGIQDQTEEVFLAPEDAGLLFLQEETVSESHFIPQKIAVIPVKEKTISVSSGTKGYEGAENIFIKNETNLSINIKNMLQNPVSIKANNNGPQVLIIHTHTTEAYIDSKGSQTQRTLDLNYSVARVGKEIQDKLQEAGIETIHVTDVFDSPSYNGSYQRSLKAIEEQLSKYPTIQVVIDVHRDAIIDQDGTHYKMVTTIEDEKVAQMMLVMGSSAGGLQHDNWAKNVNFAIQLQKRMSEKYQDIMRPTLLRASRYNQQMSVGSILIEVGSSGNKLEEALRAANLFGKELADYLNGN